MSKSPSLEVVIMLTIAVRHDFPYLHKWLKNLYWNYPAFKDTTNFERTSHPHFPA